VVVTSLPKIRLTMLKLFALCVAFVSCNAAVIPDSRNPSFNVVQEILSSYNSAPSSKPSSVIDNYLRSDGYDAPRPTPMPASSGTFSTKVLALKGSSCGITCPGAVVGWLCASMALPALALRS
jgi:hypothetical protein